MSINYRVIIILYLQLHHSLSYDNYEDDSNEISTNKYAAGTATSYGYDYDTNQQRNERLLFLKYFNGIPPPNINAQKISVSGTSYIDKSNNNKNYYSLMLRQENQNDQQQTPLAIETVIQQFSPIIEKEMLQQKNRIEFGFGAELYRPDPIVYVDYDFIIVGSGPAGCVLANRLSENPKWRILLLEAGSPENIIANIPALAGYLQSTGFNWGYKAERSDRFCWGMDEQQCGFPRGKALGGTSVINYMIYNRGNRRDFDSWADGWSYEEVLPYFLKSEGANLRYLRKSPYHNRNGPWSVEDPRHRTILADAYVEANQEAGYRPVDYNGETQMGVSYVQANTLRGKRHTAAKAYLEPILKTRRNLHVLTGARVTKVLINPQTKQAYGVEYIKRRRKFTIKSTKEVILSAGAFNSPQLLMLSGVGPRSQLDRHGIPQIHELPVGQILYDHMSHFGPTFIVNTTNQAIGLNRIMSLNVITDYFKGQGPLTVIGGVEALTFVKTRFSDKPPDVPDVELIFVAGSLHSDEGTGLRRGMRITDEIYNTVYRPLENRDTWSVMPMLFHPKSVGHMELKNSNPSSWPLFYPNYFDDEVDVENLLAGIKEAIRISKMPALQRLGSRLHDIPLPNCAHHHFGSDNYWRCSIRTLSCTLHHQVGTCRMGHRSDPRSVVSSSLRVHGIKRLRVVDTSVIPEPPTSHTNAVSFMIGEKAADMIKAYWQKRS